MPGLKPLSPRRAAVWAALYAALAVARLAPLSLHPASRLADDGDAPLVAWTVWWSAHHLFSGARLFDANAFHPHPGGLLYAEPMLAPAVLAWPFHLVAHDPALVLNLVTVATVALTAFAFHLFAREWTGDDAAAAVGAVLYASNSYVMANLARVHIVSLEWMPLALLTLHRLMANGRARWAVALAACAVLHGLSSFYYLLFFPVVLAVLVPAEAWLTGAWRRPRTLAWLGAAGLACAAVLLPVATPYVRLFRRYGFTGDVRPFDLALYLAPPRGALLYGAWAERLRPAGFYLDYFLGYAALALAALGLVALMRQRPRARGAVAAAAWLAVGLLGLAFSAGVDARWRGSHLGTGPFALLRHLAPFANLREPRRFAVLVILSVAMLVACGAAALIARVPRRVRPWLAVALAALLALEHVSPQQTQGVDVPAGSTVPDVYRWLATWPGGEAVAELPARPARLQRFMSLDQYFSTAHGKPITTGWPSFFPPALELFLWDLRGFPDARSLAALRAMDVRLALIHPLRWEDDRRRQERRLAEREDVLPLLARFPERDLPAWARYGLGGEEVRAVRAVANERAPRECGCLEVPRAHYRLEANAGGDPAAAADGSLATRWSTGADQARGQSLEVVFDRPRAAARVEVEMAFPYGEFARHIEVRGERGNTEWVMGPLLDIGYDVELLRRLVRDPIGARLRYDLEAATVDRLRLVIARPEDGVGAWSVPEIHVYEVAP